MEDEVTILMRITVCLNITGRLCAVALCLMLFFTISPCDGCGQGRR